MNIDLHLLHGKHVYLDFLKEEHIPVLRALAKNEKIWEYTKTLLIDNTYDEQFDRYIALALSNESDGSYSSGRQQSFTIFRKEDNAIIGMTRYYGIDEKQKRLAIGYTWYIPEAWGTVHNKECKLLLLQYAFDTLSFNRVEFHVAHQNIRSQKAVEKIGGVKEGVLRKHAYRPDGSIRNTIIFSIINDEWPQKKMELMQRIAAKENKDDSRK